MRFQISLFSITLLMLLAAVLLWINFRYVDHPMGPEVKFQGWPEHAIWNGFDYRERTSIVDWPKLEKNIGFGIAALFLATFVLFHVDKRKPPRPNPLTVVFCGAVAVAFICANLVPDEQRVHMQTMDGRVVLANVYGWPFNAYGPDDYGWRSSGPGVGGIFANAVVFLALECGVLLLSEFITRNWYCRATTGTTG